MGDEEPRERDPDLPRRVRMLTEVSPAMTPGRIVESFREHVENLRTTVGSPDAEGTIRSIIRYALGEAPETAEYARKHAARFLSLAFSSVLQNIGPGDLEILERVDPYGSDLCVVCCAALGRYRLEVEQGNIPDGWFAALAGLKLSSVRVYVCHKRIRRPSKTDRRNIRYRDAIRELERKQLT